MNTAKDSFPILDLVKAWESAQLRRNPEYQRGAAWSVAQKQALIDSAFRGYPLPPLYLEKRVAAAPLGGGTSEKFDVVDGQQRLLAFHEFYSGKFALLAPDNKKLRLPKSLRAVPAPWAGRRYAELNDTLRQRLDATHVDVLLLDNVTNPDQVRDLFIRLQSGTALTRQQIRDAWPGNAGPYIQKLAGKLDQRPTAEIFRYIDKRGTRAEEEDLKDEYVTDRQTCAQLLRLFLARERDPRATASVGAADLDALYHEHTDFDTQGESARHFERCLQSAAEVFHFIEPASSVVNKGKRTKVLKLDAFATVMFFQDVLRNPLLRFGRSQKVALAKRIAASRPTQRTGKSTSGNLIRQHYESFRMTIAEDIGTELDPQRLFTESQKQELYRRDSGLCGICLQPVEPADAECDHHPVPYRDGGRTEIGNGRLVHVRCHPRGRPAEDEFEQ